MEWIFPFLVYCSEDIKLLPFGLISNDFYRMVKNNLTVQCKHQVYSLYSILDYWVQDSF